MIKRPGSLISMLLFFSFTVFGQPLNTSKLDSFFSVLAGKGMAMGSLAISLNGHIVYQRALGDAFLDSIRKTPADIYTEYRIGSDSKMFTAVMIFQLIEEGRLRLDQKLAVYFPGLPNADKITIGNLLDHRSGLHNYTEDTGFPDWMDKPKTHEQMLRIVTEKGADFEPGIKAQYSNTNYLILSYILEKVSNMTYSQALTKRITAPLGLKYTYYGGPPDIQKKESASYKYENNGWVKQKETELSIHEGAGSIVSTPSDLVRFINALFALKLVKASSLDQMKTMVDGFGMGMFSYNHGSNAGYGHNGRIEEFYTAVRYYPDKKLSYAYCTNGILFPRIDVLMAIERICFNEPYRIPFSQTPALTVADLDKYLGKYAATEPPINVNCLKDSTGLLLESRGKTMEVQPIGDNYFMHGPSGSFFEFIPEKGELQIKETDNVYYLKRI